MHIKKLAVTKEGYLYFIDDLNRTLHVHEGAIDREVLLEHKHSGLIKTSKGDELLFAPATFKDNMDRMKRKAAMIIPKDIGFLIAECGLTKESVVLDCGAGSGGATCQLAALCKKVYSYDNNKDHVEVVKENCERMELDNVICEEKDIVDVDLVEEVDVAIIDLPDPLVSIPVVKKALKQSGYVAFYTPHINQAQALVNALDEDFKYVTTIEIIQRRWEVDELKLRPKHNMLGHTAFLTIVRKFERK